MKWTNLDIIIFTHDHAYRKLYKQETDKAKINYNNRNLKSTYSELVNISTYNFSWRQVSSTQVLEVASKMKNSANSDAFDTLKKFLKLTIDSYVDAFNL